MEITACRILLLTFALVNAAGEDSQDRAEKETGGKAERGTEPHFLQGPL